MLQNPMSDTIIDEIHRTRREMSDKFHGDFRLMLEDARRRQAESGRPIWRPNTTNQVLHEGSGGTSTSHNQSTPGTP